MGGQPQDTGCTLPHATNSSLPPQQCQEAQGALGTQAFYRVVLSLGFAEMAAPILWTVESSFHCVGESHGEDVPAGSACGSFSHDKASSFPA